MGADFWWQFVNERIMDFIQPASQRVVFHLQFHNLSFQLFNLLSDHFPLCACRARATFEHRTGDWLVLGTISFTTAAEPRFHHRIIDELPLSLAKPNEMIEMSI